MGGNLKKIQTLSDADWIKALNRLELKQDLPITLQGGEPTLHKDFYYIINNLREDIKIDILTNLKFDVKK
ncbi:MAG TPA: radical SAM protein, partial [bacterium]|nr:radical SAM protein [bacterium]